MGKRVSKPNQQHVTWVKAPSKDRQKWPNFPNALRQVRFCGASGSSSGYVRAEVLLSDSQGV